MRSKLIFLSLCLSLFINAGAQQTQNTLEPPPLKSFWGGYSEGSQPLAIVKGLVDSALFVIDDKKKLYPITRFRCVYKSIGTMEDPQTGETKTVHDVTSQEFFNTGKLSGVWISYLKDLIKAGEEIWFVDIIVSGKNHMKFYAPDIKVKVY